MTRNIPVLVQVGGEQSRFTTDIKLDYPINAIEGTQKLRFSVTGMLDLLVMYRDVLIFAGDLLGMCLANLEILPYQENETGEQALFAIIQPLALLRHLSKTKRLHKSVRMKLLHKLKLGVARAAMYR